MERQLFASASSLCVSPSAVGLRTWHITCRDPVLVVSALRHSPLFAGARVRLSGRATVDISLPFRWRRMPAALAGVLTRAPGAFRLASATRDRIVARRGGVTLVFRRMNPRLAALAFRRGSVDEAPVPLGDLRAARLDPRLRGEVHVRALAGIDLLVFARHGSVARLPLARQTYWQTADRTNYVALVPEYAARPSFGLAPGAPPSTAASTRAALAAIPSLPTVRVRIVQPRDSVLRYGLGILYGQWRQIGLGPQLVAPGARRADARFERVLAPYDAPEGLFAALAIRAALAARDLAALRQIDSALERRAFLIPVSGVADARLVSSRLHGWHEDALGTVDYTRLTLNTGG